MPAPAADPPTPRTPHTPKALAGLAALACIACCALPVLIAAGVIGTGASALLDWLPALALTLGVLAAGAWWLSHRRRSCSCGDASSGAQEGGCTCQAPAATR
ncbi:hypothetical protein [Streptomyces aidingensis]|uniref:Mercuric ion transport protein n=1 Tax=Streptomyces aidingensis TaxID=910347 RepID=A0A1I1TV73_9ACTN|nr:hypothetical protein [Streptomyces aidingensis]SFD62497.1 mercuric ion transport protein [Streptomyces aidingensis]